MVHLHEGGFKPGDVDADLGCQLGRCFGAVDHVVEPAGGDLAVRLHTARQQHTAGIALAVLGIEYQPGRCIGLGALMVGIHRIDDVRVGRGFIDEALAQSIDHHATGRRTLNKQGALARLPWHLHCRSAPGVFHQRHRTAGLQPGANAVAMVYRRRRRPLGLRGLGQIQFAHRLVRLETAAGKHHTVPRPQALSATLAQHFDANHPALIQLQ
ncbi:hypothetical protein D9M69_454660 [compost metagenome]